MVNHNTGNSTRRSNINRMNIRLDKRGPRRPLAANSNRSAKPTHRRRTRIQTKRTIFPFSPRKRLGSHRPFRRGSRNVDQRRHVRKPKRRNISRRVLSRQRRNDLFYGSGNGRIYDIRYDTLGNATVRHRPISTVHHSSRRQNVHTQLARRRRRSHEKLSIPLQPHPFRTPKDSTS